MSSVQLPLASVNTTPPPVTGQIVYVNSGGNLQAAINAAQPGDEIVLQAGATFTGPITLPNKTGSGWITITSSGAGALTPGARVDPSEASQMATILAPGSNVPALKTAAGAHNYYISGLNITTASSVTTTTDLVELGTVGSAQNTVAQEPYNIIIDRSYIHGSSTLDLRRAISLQSASTAIINSYISDVHAVGADSQAIAGWNGSGPYLIQNNFLEASGENVMFGGADPSIPNLIPSDITIQGNDFYKPLSWQGSQWSVKNLFELKLGNRVLVQNNTFENNWANAQDGYAILLRSTDQDGTAPWSVVSNVTFQQNTITNSPSGINLDSELGTAVGMSNININNNLLYNIGSGGGRLFQILGYQGVPIQNLSITNNTAIGTSGLGMAVMFDAATSSGAGSTDAVNGLVFSNNVLSSGQYGVFGSGKGTGNAALSAFAPGGVFTGNVIIGGTASAYSSYPGNYFPISVSFVSPSTGNYNLTTPSLYDGGNAGDQFINSKVQAAPTVTITSAAVTTSSSAQTITGTVDVADAGSTVKILDGTTQIGSATVAANGAWSANVTLLNQGANVLKATDTNAAGTGTSNSITDTLHSVVPTVAITSAAVTTSSSAQTITGTVDVADAGSTVKILDGTTQIGSATVAANGAWSANVTLLNQGANVLKATDTNAAGTGTSNSITDTLHTVVPTVAITSAAVTTSSSAQTITGTVDVADAGSTVKILDGTTQIGSATVAANGAWSANVTLLNQGANVLKATDTNAAGTGTSNSITDTLHTVVPTVAITSAAVTTSSSAQTITGTVDVADAGSTVKILDGTTQIGSATVAANGAWSANVTLLNQGANVLKATDTNAAGTGTSNSITDTLHTVVPTVAITSAAVTTSSSAQTITGTVDVADAGSTVKILDGTTQIGSATVAANGAWSANVTLLNQGANVLKATDTNAAGTGTSNSITDTLHSVVPTVAITSAAVTTSSSAQTITGTVDVADAGSTVKILDGTTQIGSATVAANGAWSANVTLLNQGANVLKATDTNAAGTGTSNSITDTLHSVVPTVAITSAAVTTSSSAQTITGTVDVADAGSTVKILDGTTQIGSATVAANGAWSANVTLLNQGANVLKATDTNAAGTGTSNSITDTLHSVVPTVAITSAAVTTSSSAQTITGTVDVADAGSTVKILDGTTQIGSATVAANGAWSANVTLLNQGANVLTATDTNAAGTGTSNSITDTLQTVDPPVAITSAAGTSSVQLPLASVNTTPPPVTGQIVYVNSGGNLQAAINAAQPGDEIVLQAGATFTGPITLPNKTGSGWITITSSGAGALTPGARVDPSEASQMATILAPGSNVPALKTAAGAHNYYISGLNITTASSVTTTTDLVELGTVGSAQNTVAQEPYNIIIDRSYIHGSSTLDLRRAISLQSASTAIINSYISDVHAVGADSQAIAGWNGSGPYLIQNNFLEASGENVMFGGADPSIPNLIPSDITIQGNDFYKPLSWQGSQWSVKNLFELKLGNRVLVQNNTFENNWANAQDGYAILIRSTDQDGTAPWSVVSNVTFQQNTITNSPSGINLDSELGTAVGMSNININNNLLYNIGSGGGRLFQILGYQGVPIQNLSITNNTAIGTSGLGMAVMFDAATSSGAGSTDAVNGLVFSNNVLSSGQYGVFGSGKGTGNAALSAFAPGGVFTGNVIIGGTASAYSSYPGNYFPISVSFVSPSTGNYNLTTPSLYDGGAAGDQFIDPPGAPTVAITSAGGTTASASQIIAGTVDVADAGSTVKVFDGTTQVGAATVTANGAWSVNITLANQGVNVLTATDTNAAGLGISKGVLYSLQSAASMGAVTSVVNDTSSNGAANLLASSLLRASASLPGALYPQIPKSSSDLATLLTSGEGADSTNSGTASHEMSQISGLNLAAFEGAKAYSGLRDYGERLL